MLKGEKHIDVFSRIARCIASVHTDKMREWTQQVLLPTQYASRGGIEVATAVMNTHVEKVLGRLGHSWCVSVDFGKLFNTISVEVVEAVVGLMGLEPTCAEGALCFLRNSKGVWRLPQNGIGPWRKYARGLPQGMSTSVTFAEVFLSLLLWRVKYIVPSVCISYVDDLTFQTDTRDRLNLVLKLLCDFVRDFSLNLSMSKTQVWGTHVAQIGQVAQEWGLNSSDCLVALGMEWALHPQGTPSYKKENHRVELCKERLRRLQHLPASITTKLVAAKVGCLSLLTYGPAPSRAVYSGVLGPLKKALALPYAAPEVLLVLLPTSPLDIDLLWIMGLLKLLVIGITHASGAEVWEAVPQGRRHSRFATLKKQIAKMGWAIELPVLKMPGFNDIRLDRPWSSVRDKVMESFTLRAIRKLEERRPLSYGGLSTISRKAHRKLLDKMPPYRAMTLVKVWTGCAMTRAHKHTVGGEESAMCPCGIAEQTVYHLLYVCPLSPTCTPSASLWSLLPPASSSSLLFLSYLPQWLIPVWHDVCNRAVDILSQQQAPRPTLFDWKNHVVTLSHDAQYAFCIRCLVVRKSRDHKFIASSECSGQLFGNDCCEGDYIKVGGHLARCMFRSWKRAASRPKMLCVLCGKEWWPSSAVPVRCA